MTAALAIGLPLIVGAGLALAAINSLLRRPALGAGLVLGTTVLHAAVISAPPLVAPGGVAVQLPDVTFGLLLCAAIARLLWIPRLTALQRCLVLLSSLVLLSLIRGVGEFGLQSSVAEFRLYMYFLSGALYFTSFPASVSRNHQIGKIWLAMSVFMIMIAGERWLATFAGIDLGLPAERWGADSAIRVIDGPYVFFLACAAVLTVSVWQVRNERARRWRSWGVVVLLVVLVLDRRTVWLALLAGLALLVLRNPRFRRRAFVMATAAALGTVWLLFTFSSLHTGDKPFAQHGGDTGNFEWRVAGWSELVGNWSKDSVHWLVGEPFGKGFARNITRSEETSHPHNFYIQTLLRTGVPGLAALIAIQVGLLQRLWRMGRHGGVLLAPLVFPALLIMQMVWFFTWVPGMEQGIVTGLALALAATYGPGRRRGLSRPESSGPGYDAGTHGLSPVGTG